MGNVAQDKKWNSRIRRPSYIVCVEYSFKHFKHNESLLASQLLTQRRVGERGEECIWTNIQGLSILSLSLAVHRLQSLISLLASSLAPCLLFSHLTLPHPAPPPPPLSTLHSPVISLLNAVSYMIEAPLSGLPNPLKKPTLAPFLYQEFSCGSESLELRASPGNQHTDWRPYILWDDIQEAFPSATRLQCGEQVVSFMIGGDRNRYVTTLSKSHSVCQPF